MYRQGYFKSEEEEHQAIANVLLEFEEAKRRVAVLRYEAQKFAQLHEDLAKSLRDKLETVSFDLEEHTTSARRLAELCSDLNASCAEVDRLRKVTADLGFTPRD